MKISLSPQRCDKKTPLIIKDGDILIINSISYDFSLLSDGATLPSEAIDCEWIVSDVERISGQIELTLLLPHGPDAAEETRFPQPIINPPDGEITLPPYN